MINCGQRRAHTSSTDNTETTHGQAGRQTRGQPHPSVGQTAAAAAERLRFCVCVWGGGGVCLCSLAAPAQLKSGHILTLSSPPSQPPRLHPHEPAAAAATTAARAAVYTLGTSPILHLLHPPTPLPQTVSKNSLCSPLCLFYSLLCC